MSTFLDLLVVVFIMLSAVSLLSILLMFLVRNPIVRKVCFYIVVVLGIYTSIVAVRISNFTFPVQTTVAFITGISSIVAFILERMNKGDEEKFLIARILSATALLVSICNAFIF